MPDMCPSGQITNGAFTVFAFEIAGVCHYYFIVLQEINNSYAALSNPPALIQNSN